MYIENDFNFMPHLGPLAVAHARDVAFMKRTLARYQLRQGMSANKLFKSRGRNDQQ